MSGVSNVSGMAPVFTVCAVMLSAMPSALVGARGAAGATAPALVGSPSVDDHLKEINNKFGDVGGMGIRRRRRGWELGG